MFTLIVFSQNTHTDTGGKPFMKALKSAAFGVLFGLGSVLPSHAQDFNFFTIGTGGVSLTYYPVGGMIANAISKPPGSRECGQGGSCGVDGLIASAVSTRGSVDNLTAIASGLRDSGFAQSDLAYWAYSGTGSAADRPAATELRTIAGLFQEHIHLVTLKDSGIAAVADLKGKRVSLDERGSGTFVDANLILKANGFAESDLQSRNLKGADASRALRNGTIDAFFIVAGYPTKALVELASNTDMALVPIDGPAAIQLTQAHSFFSSSIIPETAYDGVKAVPTISVGAQWYTHQNKDEELIYQITKALWNPETRQLLDEGHAAGRTIAFETALDGLSVPLHAGAARFYKEQGLLD
jgi:TRAP transporter TAXI family solute receptor